MILTMTLVLSNIFIQLEYNFTAILQFKNNKNSDINILKSNLCGGFGSEVVLINVLLYNWAAVLSFCDFTQ